MSQKGRFIAASRKWFDRKFDFSFGVEEFNGLIQRLGNSPFKLSDLVADMPVEIQSIKIESKWSIKENIGHLIVLEPLWRARVLDIKEQREVMSPADLSNTLTNDSDFNSTELEKLLRDFESERGKTLELLSSLLPYDLTKTSMHPRLSQPMRVVDLMYFVAEHDQHHFDTIVRIKSEANKQL